MHKYELGIIVNGGRFVVWTGTEFPPTGFHDMVARMTRVVQNLLPHNTVTWFHECDGQSYSY